MSNVIVVDVENTITRFGKDKKDFSPYNKDNKLVSVGWTLIESGIIQPVKYAFFNHAEGVTEGAFNLLQEDLNNAEVFVAHNAKHDYNWLYECGFHLPSAIHCTFVAEYVLARGQRVPLDLGSVSKRYNTHRKQSDLTKQYMDDGVSFYDIPKDIVQEYGVSDVQACAEIYLKQLDEYNKDDNKHLIKTRDLSWEFTASLCDMERNGVLIDVPELERVTKLYQDERAKLLQECTDIVKDVMGDYPYNIGSPEQLSEIVYSISVKDKKEWAEQFNITKDDRGKANRRPKIKQKEFDAYVRSMTEPVYKHTAHQCPACEGLGKIQKVKKDGTARKNKNICRDCEGRGMYYTPTDQRAGFGCKHGGIEEATIGGFTTNKHVFERLLIELQDSDNERAKTFIRNMIRLNAVDTYIDTFCLGIANAKQHDNILHTKFNQCVTSTGRLSSTDPNMQNMPRAKTFPIRKVFKSRFEGGQLIETDFSQLEFRCAIHLAKDQQGKHDVENGLDIHAQTASVLTEAGQKTDRQEAKSRSFKPLYGGISGTPAERTYYKKFLEIYSGVANWHKSLEEEALKNFSVRLPTGREYAFPNVHRNYFGGASQKTQIVNFPVQGFATADIVPAAICTLRRTLIKHGIVKSLLILTVHDSVVIDAHPDEIEKVLDFMKKLDKMAEWYLKTKYDITMYVSLACETKIGENLLEMKVA